MGFRFETEVGVVEVVFFRFKLEIGWIETEAGFVEGNRNNRKEIHVIGYQPTKLANTDLFGGNND